MDYVLIALLDMVLLIIGLSFASAISKIAVAVEALKPSPNNRSDEIALLEDALVCIQDEWSIEKASLLIVRINGRIAQLRAEVR